MNRKIRILGISGSLRANSSASAVLNIVAGLVPGQVEFTIYTGLAEVPAFNDSNEIPETVEEFIKLLSGADGVFFVIPEYAFGVPGALKNALDLSLIHISEPTRLLSISYAVFCLKKKKKKTKKQQRKYN